MQKYFQMKVENYKEQDENAGREIDNDYVTAEWIEEEFKTNRVCYICKELIEFEIKDDHVHSNLTLDRIDNSIAHTKDNCQICCKWCNCSKR